MVDYPAELRDELTSRFKSGDHRAFSSATFELVLFALLRSTGCSIVVHPHLNNGTGQHPDFLVTARGGESAYVEAVIASEFSEADISARKRTDVVLNAIENMDSPNFFLGINAEGHPERPPNGRSLRAALGKWLASLDPDVVATRLLEEGSGALPTFEWEQDGWRINIEAIPKKPEKRGLGQRIIGSLFGGVRFVNSWEPIRDAVKAKGNHYSELDRPLVVAVNVDAGHVDRIDEMQGLFGEEEYVFRRGDPSPPDMRRRPNGAWFGPNGPQYTRVSGAWIFENLNPWNLVTRSNTLYFNPWAERPIPALFTLFNHARAADEKMQWISGQAIGGLLGLPVEWPE